MLLSIGDGWAQQRHYGRKCIGVSPSTCAAGYGLVDVTGASDGDTASIPVDSYYEGPLFYIYDADSGLAQSIPTVVDDPSVGGDQRWVLSATPIPGGGTGAFTATAARTNLEITEDVKCIMWEDPVDTDDFQSIFTALEHNVTVTRVQCESDGTVVLDLQNDGVDIVDASTDLSCDLNGDSACGSGCGQTIDGDATVDQGDAIDVKVVSVAGGATRISICFTLQRP